MFRSYAISLYTFDQHTTDIHVESDPHAKKANTFGEEKKSYTTTSEWVALVWLPSHPSHRASVQLGTTTSEVYSSPHRPDCPTYCPIHYCYGERHPWYCWGCWLCVCVCKVCSLLNKMLLQDGAIHETPVLSRRPSLSGMRHVRKEECVALHRHTGAVLYFAQHTGMHAAVAAAAV